MTTHPAPRTERIVDHLFDRLLAMYGKHWLDLWGETPMKAVKAAWAAGIAPYGRGVIALAIEHLQKNNKFPPTCPEFVMICRNLRPPPEQVLALPDKTPRGPIPPHVQAQLDAFCQRVNVTEEVK